MAGYRRIRVTPSDAALGAEIECGRVQDLDAEATEDVRRAWLENLVLMFRNQKLSDPELVTFGRRFGELLLGTVRPKGMKPRDEAVPEINVISNVIENELKIGNLGDGEAVWHTDRSHQAEPLSASILHALEVPPAQGDTSWANMYLAFDTLSGDLKRRVCGLSIEHDASLDSAGNPRSGFKGEGAVHPIVRTHPETGCSALYLGRRPNARIPELDERESEEMLDMLWHHATRPHLVWRHRWRVGDVLVWDNRCTLHYREAFDPATRRIMHRVQVKGTRPYRAPDALTREPHARAQLATA